MVDSRLTSYRNWDKHISKNELGDHDEKETVKSKILPIKRLWPWLIGMMRIMKSMALRLTGVAHFSWFSFRKTCLLSRLRFCLKRMGKLEKTKARIWYSIAYMKVKEKHAGRKFANYARSYGRFDASWAVAKSTKRMESLNKLQKERKWSSRLVAASQASMKSAQTARPLSWMLIVSTWPLNYGEQSKAVLPVSKESQYCDEGASSDADSAIEKNNHQEKEARPLFFLAR